jgi:hypothetical protein
MIESQMKPSYEITPSILKLITSISEKILSKYNLLNKPLPKLRKQFLILKFVIN